MTRRRLASSLARVAGLSLPAHIPTFAVWGTNTDVGKTLVSAGLARVARDRGAPTLFLKPVQTGFPQDSDARFVAGLAGLANHSGWHAQELEPLETAARRTQPGDPSDSVTLFAWSHPQSPHRCVAREGRGVTDDEIRHSIAMELGKVRQHVEIERERLHNKSRSYIYVYASSSSPTKTRGRRWLHSLHLPPPVSSLGIHHNTYLHFIRCSLPRCVHYRRRRRRRRRRLRLFP